ncbi:MAG: 3-isopropylmalate dehydratase small subunit 1 [Alphaproteobacteria bacterium MarineAlpha5_Bin9]|nr:MAG: 3-isopropylmalate dehydratase small subunit 1 [Alphaproteobacteria bacterium MarineAlpha5_Bin9]
MKKFINLKSIPASLPMINVDTDMIIPKQFLKTIKRSGLGKNLFYELRYDLQGNIKNDFVLNWDPYKSSKILIAGDNFGCGSSREHAPWSLLDFGIRCIISTSFADIFFNNCFKNGILPIVLKSDSIDKLTSDAEKKIEIEIDLKNQKILRSNNNDIKFDIDQFRKKCLIEGLDDIGLTLEKIKNIDIYEDKHHHNFPWLT